MIKVFEDDKLKSGTKQVVMESDNLSVLIAPEVGGRIVGIQEGAQKFLHRTYPKGIEFGTYTEYGGIEECVGGAPGTLWNVPWIHEQKGRKNFKIVLSAYSRNILVKKSILLEDSEPIVNVTYELLNISDEPAKISFGIHPEISMSGKFRDSQYHIPTNGSIRIIREPMCEMRCLNMLKDGNLRRCEILGHRLNPGWKVRNRFYQL